MSRDLTEAALIITVIIFSVIGIALLFANVILGIGYFLGLISFLVIAYVIVFIFARYIDYEW